MPKPPLRSRRRKRKPALSAVVLAGLVMSWSLPVLHPAQWLLDAREPFASGFIDAAVLTARQMFRTV